MNQTDDIPLDRLRLSPLNPRRDENVDVSDLLASIPAHGLLQSLVVTRNTDGTHFDVVAGGRRLRALQQLAADGHIPGDRLIPCTVVSDEGALEAALAENIMRADMHPADEFEAFNAMAKEGRTVDEIALRYGVTEIHVRRRLKLANIAPELLEGYRAGDIELEQIMALALTDDQALQLRTWKNARGHWDRDPDRLRQALTENELSATSALGKFVGAKAYEKAGGNVRRDLFDDEDKGYLTDPALARKLAQDKLDKLAEKLQAEGWLWVEGRISFDYSDRSRFGEAPWSGTYEKREYSDEVKAYAGAVVSIDYNGKPDYWRGLVRPEDRKAAGKAVGGESKITGGKKPKEKGGLSFAAVQRLQAEASAIIGYELVDMPRTAIALLVYQLGRRAFYETSSWDRRTWTHIGNEHSGRVTGPAAEVYNETSTGAIALKEVKFAFAAALPSTESAFLPWCMQAQMNQLIELLAYLVAAQTHAIDTHDGQKNGVTALAKATGIDLAQHWKPTAEWLATLQKSVILDMVREAAGKNAAAELEKLKKDTLPAAALAKLPAGWLPKPLRPAKPPKERKAKAAGKDAAAGDDEAGED